MNRGQAREILEVERAETLKRLDALVDEFNGIVAASLDANADDEHDPERLRVLPVTESCTTCAGRPRSPLRPQP
jgi:hypothetical protein